MKKTVAVFSLALSLAFLSGCGTLLPKKVELFQDKVRAFPEAPQKEKEIQREVAQRAKEKAVETYVEAIAHDAPPAVTAPAQETALLTDALSTSVGAPADRPKATSRDLADDLREALAKRSKKVDSFIGRNDENVGKKIEGTGAVQVPYLAWLGGLALIVFVLWHLGKLALTAASAANPGALVGVGAMNVAGSLVGKGFTQLVSGGKKFVGWVNTEVKDPVLRQKIVDAFTTAHKESQDRDVRAVVDTVLPKKE